MTNESKEKIRIASLKRFSDPKQRELSRISHLGKKHGSPTLETREKLRKAQTGKKCPYITGIRNPNWKGGLTLPNVKIRNSSEYSYWRKQCFIRDNFICQKTKVSGGKLEVHHINNFSDFPELRFSIENGITLSKRSHRLFHNVYGYKNNTKEQLEEFLNK